MNDTELVDYLERQMRLLIREIDDAKKSPFNKDDDWFDGHKECAQVILTEIKKYRKV